ncbi:hypothetical protein C8N32_1492 [Rhodovulum imhoffii]|uniref:Lipoprotein n=1 Tax=Rhodovulum imhoffii TaxID=365340 RepID=A0A2T5BCB4_9RHOB|nr:hypothetical protein [Rhodovulum imhoffii]PTM96618.1 hypothetical protein C8N32_1492 [Rhodovulum imhoffii]
MRKAIISVAVATTLLTGCMSNVPSASGPSNDPQKATLLMTVGEGWGLQSGQAYVVLKNENTGRFTKLLSETDSRGGAGSADFVESAYRAFEFNAEAVDPGTYTLSTWGFEMRRGSATKRASKSVKIEAGKVYYLGSLFANNLTQTARIENKLAGERRAYMSKYPELKTRGIEDVSSSFSVKCWKMDVSDEIAREDTTSLLRDAIKNCS